MCIYCDTKNYRKIYEHHHGPIPREEDGRTYEIHHVDGDHSNNDPTNLISVTIQEHYGIHYNQGDYDACRLMKLQRMNYSVEEIKELNSKAKKGKISVKDSVTGEIVGMVSVNDERYIKRELVPVSTGLKIKLEEKNCRFCSHMFTTNILNRHEKTCHLNPEKVSLTNNVGSTCCQYCTRSIGNTNIQKHELSCDQNPNKIVGINNGKKYNMTKRVCSYCQQSIGATAHDRHERVCKLRFTKPSE